MEKRDGTASIEIVVHTFQKRGPLASDFLQELAIGAVAIERSSLTRRFQGIETLAGDPFVAFKETIKAFQAAVDLLEPLFAVIRRPAVMGCHQEEPQGLRTVAFQKLGDDYLVPLALRHFPRSDLH